MKQKNRQRDRKKGGRHNTGKPQNGTRANSDRGSGRESHTITGTVDMKSSGSAYIISPESEHDVYIDKGKTGIALHGDTVKVAVMESSPARSEQRSGGRKTRPEGRIVSVIKRNKTTYSGTVRLLKGYAYVIPDNPKMPVDVFVSGENLNSAKDGQKVIVNLIGWEPGEKTPRGEIKEVLGTPGEHSAEMNSIIDEFQLPTHFPPQVLKAVADMVETGHAPSPQELRNRRDFRQVTTFTIDPVDAKDFDDALSLKHLDNGNWEVGVHIADVSHYVTENSAVDKEAKERATSVYLVDRVIPMLPEALSNDACSLNPNEDKLCFSAVFELDEEAVVKAKWIGKTVIRSCRRFSYEEVQEIIDGKPDNLSTEIHVVNKLSKKLRSKRISEGSIPFEKTETKFVLDSKGIPVSVFFVESNEAHELIEDFMLLANRTVAELVGKIKTIPFVYRVHDVPDDEKLQKFSEFLHKAGIMSNFSKTKNLAASFNALLKDARKKPYENIINLLAIRTMAKAFYTTKNIGHYGLGFEYYTHFTSPIRRYPDLLVHRILQKYLENSLPQTPKGALNSGANSGQTPNDLEDQCKYCSQRERLAEEAERASVKYKQVQFMQLNGKGDFDGLISGAIESGFFVELKANKCEGFVRARYIEGDYFYYDEKSYTLRGKRTGKSFQLGQEVKVRLKKADLIKKQLEFELV